MSGQYWGRFSSSISRPASSLRSVARLIAQSPGPGLRLVLKSLLARRTPPQLDVYPFAAFLAEQFNCTKMLAIGKAAAENLVRFHTQFEITGILSGVDLKRFRSRYAFGTWLEGDFQSEDEITLDASALKQTVIVCTDLLERVESPASLLAHLKRWLNHAPVCLLTSPDRDLIAERTGDSSPSQQTRRGKWNVAELERMLLADSFNLEFTGLTTIDNVTFEKNNILAVIANNAARTPALIKAPPDFRVVAFMAAYNEEDIIVRSIKNWTNQGVHVHILENWSTDATYDLAQQLATHLPVTVERFPKEGRSSSFDW